MNKLDFTIESFKRIGVNSNYRYEINAIYHKSLGEPIDYYLIANNNYGFQKGNSYTCTITKEEGKYAYIDNIEQIDIDITVKNKCFKILNRYLDLDDILNYLSLNTTIDIEKEIDSSNYEDKVFTKNNLLNAYYSNYLILKLNNVNAEINEYVIDEILNNHKGEDIKELFENKPYYFAYYFNLSINNIKKLNNKNIKYSKVINSLKKFEKSGHAFVYLNQLIEDLSNNYYDIDLLRNDIDDLIKDRLIFRDKEKIYLKYNYDIEMNLINNLKERINIKPNKLDKKSIEKIDKIIKSSDFLLNKEQIEAIYNALENNITIITGGAGTGKTTIQSCIIQAVKAINEKNIVKVIALTGKASNELNKKITHLDIVKATTIHKLFNIKNDYYTNLKQIKKLDYLIIDEASMIDNNIFNAILSNIPIQCKLILVGDISQCEAIGIGTPMMYLLKLKNIIKTVIIKINNRQGNDNIIFKNANKILDCSIKDIRYTNNEFKFLEAKEKDSSKKTPMYLLKREINTLISKGYSIDDIMILSYSNNTVEKVNSNIQSIYLKSLRNDRLIIKDKVIQTKNISNIQKGIDVFNGEQGTICYIEESPENLMADVDFGDKVIRYNQNNIKQLKLAYGLTIHKCQGAQSKIVILLINEFDEKYLNRNIIYTAITRATEKVIIIGDRDTFNKCVCKLPENKNSALHDELSRYSNEDKIA
ncbi:AAA family ATPase [Clostridium sp.]|uniref:ATP-dependent DNA helicase n=1 Tax=Clostridium sp. TaxID=1506 RepID=UPI002908A76F|nr:AAA family ATPase [Clostridium sp.]MDU5108089.1 AAA family ATPase [Clostridium sp.]